MSRWVDWISQNKQNNYKLIWFINIDLIPKLSYTYEETQQNYINLLRNNIDKIYFLKNETETGGFMKACVRITKNINNHIDNLILTENVNPFTDIKILWLEDDWELNKNNIDFIGLIETFSTNYSVINLSFIRNNYIWALAPCIISYNFWYNNHYKYWSNIDTQTQEKIDPENFLGQNYLLHNNVDEKNIYNLTLICKNVKSRYLSGNHFLNCKNSFYTYYNVFENIHINEKYLANDDIFNKFENIDLFIRLTPKLCDDIGRDYMDSVGLIKNFGTDDIYKDKKNT